MSEPGATSVDYYSCLHFYFYLFISTGIHCKVHDDTYEFIIATIPGPKDTPYENIEFKLSLEFGIQYPFRPPAIKFITSVYHPNIDTGTFTLHIHIY